MLLCVRKYTNKQFSLHPPYGEKGNNVSIIINMLQQRIVWTFNIVRAAEDLRREVALCSRAEGIYSLFYSCSSSPDWLWQGGDEGEELFSSAGSSIIPVTPNRQKESSRGNLPSVSSGRRREKERKKKRKGGKTINIKILSIHSNTHVFFSL